MAKAMIITLGEQCEQTKICLKDRKPEYLVIIGTNTEVSKSSINDLLESYKIINPGFEPTKYRIYNKIEDSPASIRNLVDEFREGLKWLTDEGGIPEKDIEVDITGGRKWMSAGATMIASFLGLEMCYVQEVDRQAKISEVMQLSNAYEQTGLLEEQKADRLFNECNFYGAGLIYEFLSGKKRDPRSVEIKKLVSNCYLRWSGFEYSAAYDFLETALKKIRQYGLLSGLGSKLGKQLEILGILKQNETSGNTYFQLLEDRIFSRNVLLNLVAYSERFAGQKQYDQAVIILYRILEFAGQYKLAENGIDSGNINKEVKTKYDARYKELIKSVFNAESGIPDKISLVQCWILLFCIGDELVKKEKEEFLKGLVKKTESRNLLWWEHGNKTVNLEVYREFRSYVLENWLTRLMPGWKKEIADFEFIKF